MSTFEFDVLTDRNGTGACKWDRRTPEEKRLGIVPMSVADMEFPCAPCIVRAVTKAAEHGLYGYTDPEERYFNAVTHWMQMRHHLTVKREDISCLYGVVPAISVAVRALTAPGDGVICMTPVYYPFRDMIESNGRVFRPCALVRKEDLRYAIDYTCLEQLASEKSTTMLLLCSPHNPVGRVWTREELERIARICSAHGVTVVSDEIHFDLILHGEHTPFTCVDEKSVVLTSPSKAFNLPGLQLANILMPDPVIKRRFDAVAHADGYSNISYFGRAALIAAYEEGADWLDACLDYLRGNFDCLSGFIDNELPGVLLTPLEGTYLAWADFRAIEPDYHRMEQITRGKAHQVLDEGYIFGPEGEGFERFNFALPRSILLNQLEQIAKAIKE